MDITVAPAPALKPTRCTPSPPATPATGAIRPPTTTGALSVIGVDGDDRLAFTRHQFVWSPDGQSLISPTPTGVAVWSASTGRLTQRLDLPEPIDGGVALPAPSPDGRWIATSTPDAVWLLSTTGAPARKLGGAPRDLHFGSELGFIQPGLRFSNDGTRLSTRSQIWDLADPRAPLNIAAVRTERLDPSARRILRFPGPELVDLASGKVVHRFPPAPVPEAAAFSRDGTRLALAGDALRVYRTDTFEELLNTRDARGAVVVQLTPDGRFLLADTLPCIRELSAGPDAGATADDLCRAAFTDVWDVDAKRRVVRLPFGGARRRLSDDGKYLYGSMLNGVASVLRLADGATLQLGIHTLSIAPDGTRAISETTDGLVLTPLVEGTPVPTLRRLPFVYARDATHVVAAGSDGIIRIEGPAGCIDTGLSTAFGWGWATPRDHVPLDPTTGRFSFSPDGETVWMTNLAEVHALSTREPVERWSLKPMGTVVVVPEANVVTAQGVNHRVLHRFDGTTGLEVQPPWRASAMTWFDKGAWVHAFLARDPDGAVAQTPWQIAVSGDRWAYASMLEDGLTLTIAPDGRDVRIGGGFSMFDDLWSGFVRASPDGHTWAVSDQRGFVLVGDGGAVLRCPLGAPAHAIAFTPKGDRVLVLRQGSVRLIDAATCALRGEARFTEDAPRRLSLSADGREAIVDTALHLRVRLKVTE